MVKSRHSAGIASASAFGDYADVRLARLDNPVSTRSQKINASVATHELIKIFELTERQPDKSKAG